MKGGFFFAKFLSNCEIMERRVPARSIMKILIIENDKKRAHVLRKHLKEEHFSVAVAYDGETGFRKAVANGHDLIISNLVLPKKSGEEIFQELRARDIQTPLIAVTEKTASADGIAALDFGADDYLTAPFAVGELLARIRAVLRRKKSSNGTVWRIGDLMLDKKEREAIRAGKIITLSPKEYRILETLVRHAGHAVTRRELLDRAWNPQFTEKGNELSVHLRYLRKKIDNGHLNKMIRTVHGVGYMIRE